MTPFVEGDPVETPWSHLNPACLPILNAVQRGSRIVPTALRRMGASPGPTPPGGEPRVEPPAEPLMEPPSGPASRIVWPRLEPVETIPNSAPTPVRWLTFRPSQRSLMMWA